MKQNLTCFKCHGDTVTLTYEENRIYKVSCPCGCSYEFEHSSMKYAEEYHYKMLELYGEIDRADRLKQENTRLRELLWLAVEDMKDMASTGEGLCDTCTLRARLCATPLRGFCNQRKWQHADKLQELGIEI